MYVYQYAIGFLKYPATMGDLPAAADLFSVSLPFDPDLLALLNKGAGNLTAAAESHKSLHKIGKYNIPYIHACIHTYIYNDSTGIHPF